MPQCYYELQQMLHEILLCGTLLYQQRTRRANPGIVILLLTVIHCMQKPKPGQSTYVV